MTDVVRPVAVELNSHSELRTDLAERLDDLLEQYLDLLDQYQTARQELSTSLSSGFLSLAQANFSGQTRTRYGQDYYDERMQASRIVVIEAEKDTPSFEISKPATVETPEEAAQITTTESSTDSVEKEDEEAEVASENEESTENPSDSSSTPKPVDPLRWFGVLVPPALRVAQTQFVKAVEGPLPRLSSLAKEIRQMEVEIGRLRKQIKKTGD